MHLLAAKTAILIQLITRREVIFTEAAEALSSVINQTNRVPHYNPNKLFLYRWP